MSVNFDIECSIYRDAKDNYGRFVDKETGECIQSLTIREFCLTDRWKPVVDKLRALRNQYGDEAKKMPEYTQTKSLLPGATLSGLFDLKPTRDDRAGGMVLKSRITANLGRHTGFLCIDIDAQDNESLKDMRMVLRILRHRTEVALLMKSCSGTGYFALIPLAYPERHKEQFAALLKEYAALGIRLDRQCGDVTRIRFASYDESPYINPHAIPYDGLPEESIPFVVPKVTTHVPKPENTEDLVGKVDRLICKLEQYHIDITNDYADWFRIGFSLANLPEPYGRDFFHRVSALCDKYNRDVCDKKFRELSSPQKIGIGTFFRICKDYGVTLR